MVTMIHRLFQHLYISLISIMSIFNISLIYLIDINDEDNMDDHDENAINESMYKYSETVTEIPLDPVIDLQSRQIPDCIVHNTNQNYIRLGKTRPCHRDCKHYATKVELACNRSLEVYDKLMFAPLNNNSYQGLIMKEENLSCNINEIVENKLDIVIDDQINKSNVKDILKINSAIDIVSNLTCTLYNAFLYGFTQLFCWKDDIKDFTSAKPPDDIYSFYDSNEKNPTNIVANSNNAAEKPDELISCFKKFFLDILNDEQSRQQHLLNDQAISATTSIDLLSDQIIQDEENSIDKDKIDYDEMILPTYSMSTHFRKKRNPVCPIQG
ncbi:unnamed protein product [Rotaria sp. Silwood1]|nr:unnamed protein product [Rotaria sp. Silwood1]